MHLKLHVSKNAAPKQLLIGHLATALNIYTSNGVIVSIEDEKIPLYKGRDDSRTLYISGVALRLSKSQNSNALDIARGIAAELSRISSHVFTVQIVSPGWIHLELSDSSLAAWLDSLATGAMLEQIPGSEVTPNLSSSRLFAIQYAHARCCSLLFAAAREELIKFQEVVLDSGSVAWHLISQQQISWLNFDQQLRLNHPSELRLINELLQVVDDWDILDSNRPKLWEKVSINLSQAFEAFWCNCRIWGEVKTNSRELVQARLGLLMASQVVFRSLLEDKLGVFVPLEL